MQNGSLEIILVPEFVEECQAIITESVFVSRWALVEGYWNLGRTVRSYMITKEYAKGNEAFLDSLSGKLKSVSKRTLYRSLQFFDKYPILNDVPGGKNISWNKIIKLLPERTEKEEANEYQRIFKGIERWAKSIEGLIDLHDQDKINYHVREIKNIIAKVSGIANKSTLIIDQSIPAGAVTERTEERVILKSVLKDEDTDWMDIVD